MDEVDASEREPFEESPGRPVTRRRFLTLAAAGGGAALLARHPTLRGGGSAAVDSVLVAAVEEGSITLVQAAGQLLVELRFVNLSLSGNQLVAIDSGAPSALILDVGPQHTIEEAVDRAGGDPVPLAGATLAGRRAAASRIVVTVDPPVAFSVAELLDLADRALVVDPRAALGAGSGAPAADVTTVAVPVDVVLSPEAAGRFEVLPGVPSAGYDEQLQLRLTTPSPAPLRAIDGGTVDDAFDRPLDRSLRQELVEATTDPSSAAYPDNEALLALELRLGLHGAFAALDGAWAGSGALAAYQETVRAGRTTQVTVVSRGYLAPFGQPASIVSVTGRRFESATDGSVLCLSVNDEHLVIDGRAVSYPAPFQRFGGRNLPFVDVAVLPPGGELGQKQVKWTDAEGVPRSIPIARVFELTDAAGVPLLLDHIATDRAGHTLTFKAHGFFVSAEYAFQTSASSALATLVKLFGDTKPYALARRDVLLAGQPLAFADEDTAGSGATTKTVTSIRLGLQRPVGGTTVSQLTTAGQPAFYAAMTSASVVDPTLDVLRRAETPSAPVEVALDPSWLSYGNGAQNAARSYLRLADRTTLDFGGGGGGLVRPSLNVDLFGQAAGVTVDTGATGGSWNPMDALGDAVLLGIIELKEILGSIAVGASSPTLPGLPVISTSLEPLALPTELCFRFDWEPKVRSHSVLGHPVFVVTDDFAAEGLDSPFDGDTLASFSASACVPLDEDAADAASDLTVSLDRFALLLPPGLPAIAAFVDHVTYRVPGGGAPDLDFDVAGFQFVGPLSFLEPFRELLVGGKSDSSFTFDERGVDVDLPIHVPDVGMGVARLSDIRLGLGLFIPSGPDVDQPFTTRFSIGTRIEPLGVTIYFLKGTASFEVVLQPAPIGVASFAASMGIGAEIGASGFGVSGSIGIEISVSIDYESTGDGGGRIVVGGKFVLHGEITVFAVLGVGLRATLALRYFVNTEVLRARGTVVGYVSLFGARKEWRVETSDDYQLGDGAASLTAGAGRGLAVEAAGGEASFGDAYTASQWSTYCAAFA